MIKTLSILFLAFALNSCSSSDEKPAADEEGFSAGPVSGTIYGDQFTYIGGYATRATINEVDKLSIRLSEANLDCTDFGSSNIPVSITCPAVIGVSTANNTIFFKDVSQTDGDFVTATNVQVEITSIGATVKGKIKGKSLGDEGAINGTFEVPLCL